MHEDLRRDIDVSEHIYDRLCGTVQLMRKPKYSRNNRVTEVSMHPPHHPQ